MPQKNAIKEKVPESYYHVYARGGSKQPVFLETADYKYFLGLFARYLSAKPTTNRTGIPYPHYSGNIEVLAYCLMRNHFHLLIYQLDSAGMEKLMRSIMTSYSRYFNLKYKRSGALFESRYKARRIDQQSYLEHISRYIHLNPKGWETYRFSSLQCYLGSPSPEWLVIDRISSLFSDPQQYRNFMADYEETRDMLSELKLLLADS